MFPGYCIVFSFYWKTTLLTERNKWGPKKPVQVVAWQFAVSSDAQLTFVYTVREYKSCLVFSRVFFVQLHLCIYTVISIRSEASSGPGISLQCFVRFILFYF